MKVYDSRLGRVGNALFRYFASTLFCIFYNAERTYNENECTIMFDDNMFINWMTIVLNNNAIPDMSYFNNSVLHFNGYYQHDHIFIKFKDLLLDWIKNHPNDLIYTDGNNEKFNYYNYNMTNYKVNDFINYNNSNNIKFYDVVLHLRLEDFINNNHVIHPDSIKTVLAQIKHKTICIVMNKPKLQLELDYIDYFKEYNIILQSGSIIEDFHVMKNAKILICSNSTISWIASFLSNTVQYVFFPDYQNKAIHETFKYPIHNTVLYHFNYCTKNELEILLSKKLSQTSQPITIFDPYCALNFKKEPITNRILDYIKSIKNGFYIEVGAYDGVLESNTKFLEEKYGWTGILIEPSPNTFIQLQKNRPNNILINKCIVSNTYSEKNIMGAFDCGPMSSVNNIRNIQDAALISVECDTLNNILNDLTIQNIDFMTIDTEGYEFEVLNGLNIQKYRPTYIMIEIYEYDKNKIVTFLQDNNYILIENITNYNKFDNPGWDGTHNDYLFKAL
jgi:FkbM family methyltransferase